MITVTFKDDNGQWSEDLSLIEIAKLSHSAVNKILRFGHSDHVRELQEQVARLNVLVEERDKTLDEYDARNNPAVAALAYALDLDCAYDMKEFLNWWNLGEFDVIRDGWPDVPDEVFEGADPLHGL